MEEIWRMFRNIYNKGVETYVPKQRQEKYIYSSGITEDAVRQWSKETKLGTNVKKQTPWKVARVSLTQPRFTNTYYQ